MAAPSVSAVPDILAPGLRCVFCGINPGRRSSAAGHHFANPRNDFWRLLADAGLTPRRLDPSEQWSLLELGLGLTNAAYRTTKGSGDLRRGDFEGSRERLEALAEELRPGTIAFVGKSAFQGGWRCLAASSGSRSSARRRRASSCCHPRLRRTLRFPTRSVCAGSASSLASLV